MTDCRMENADNIIIVFRIDYRNPAIGHYLLRGI